MRRNLRSQQKRKRNLLPVLAVFILLTLTTIHLNQTSGVGIVDELVTIHTIDGLDPDSVSAERGDELRLTWESLDNNTHQVVLREATDYNFTLYGRESYEMILFMNFDENIILHFDVSNCTENLEVEVTEYVKPKFTEDHASITLVATMAICLILVIIAGILFLRKKRKTRGESETPKNKKGKRIKQYFHASYREIDPILARELKKMRELKGKPANAEQISLILDATITKFKEALNKGTSASFTVAREMKFLIAVNRQLLAQNRHLAGRLRDREIEVQGFYRRMEKMGESIAVAGAIDLSDRPLKWDTGAKKIWEKYKFLWITLLVFLSLLGIFLIMHFTGQTAPIYGG